ncbi:hypothetical protein H2199_003059 [Coniosporium tulheliwenetii]|uniref:Uncharacterized protein n=1 Tax=Coniosporium tulheliwenetii TaxID=3383036 RepID=A0ACC2ZCR3_9PEZI|nr:hypothetical protein H2199_003059 [Cladosporium sp. JES 115]
MDYREKAPAQRYMGFRSAVSAPDIPPWLATGEGRKYANSFSQQRISNPLFHSSKMLEDILQPALLWERKAEHYAYSDQFSARARFSATFHRTMRGKHFLIKIRIRGQSIQCGGEWVLPEDGCTAAVRVMEGAIIPTPVISPVLWSGKLRRAPGSFGCDLFMIYVATERKMAAVEKAAHFVSPLEHDVHQQTKLEWFSLRNVLFGGRGERGRQSPNFVTQFHNSSDLLSQEVDRIRNLVLNIIPRGLNLPQKNAYDSLLSGAPAALALVEGLPGAGKMECLTRFTYALALMNFRVLYVTEADAGAQVAASSFHQYSTVSGKGELNHAFVRLLHANAEALPDPCNASPQTNPETLLELDAVECLLDPVNAHAVLAARIEAFVTIPHNRNNQAVKDYLLYKNNFDKGLPAPRRKGLDAYSKVWSRLEQLIFRAHRVVFSTLTAAHGLYNRGFQADVVILDEASHTSTPAALQPLVDQEKIKLVVLAGDSHQLDPCVLSAARSTNPLANWLQISALDYSLAQPWNHRFRLNQNFRSHPDIVALTSELFYKKELVPDLTSVMHYADALTLTVQTALGSLYFNIFQQHDWRRCFFVDVPSLPEAEPNGASHANPGGINAILTMVRGLVAFGMSGDDIGIITMYRFDRDEMAAGLEHAGISSVECGTIDAFQGREQPIVILHFVAAFSPQGPFSFTRDRQRLCVALSRARRYLFVFGNLSYWEAHEGRWAYREKLMANFVNIVRRQQGPIVRVRYPQNRVDTVLTHRL